MTKPSPKAGQRVGRCRRRAVNDDVATRIANSIGPAFEGFAPIAGTLPMDLEPASYLLVQTAKVSK